uniref:Uncharacterized protein n=1 Tax=Anguilla anguilla TaxID=7936 RepID=A0A0E9QAU2_ANGAN
METVQLQIRTKCFWQDYNFRNTFCASFISTSIGYLKTPDTVSVSGTN